MLSFTLRAWALAIAPANCLQKAGDWCVDYCDNPGNRDFSINAKEWNHFDGNFSEGKSNYDDGSPFDTGTNGCNCGCWKNSALNSFFVILWGIAAISLWLRLIIFCTLSHSLGPMVQMIFRMMQDIGTFFKIMLILFAAFSMCLMYTLGDIHDDFKNPMSAALSLFLAVIGEVDFGGFDDIEGASLGVRYFGIAVVVTYVIVGSLVFLNLLIAMMAKTFDTIQEDTTAAIIFARFDLALELDTTAAFMPPPLNVLTMIFMAFFYIFEGMINGFRWLVYRLSCRKMNSREINTDEMSGEDDLGKRLFCTFDFACPLMPGFMIERKLELDEQILFKNCNQYFHITTNKGLTKCKVVRYKPEITQHYVEFYKDDENGKECRIRVSVNNKIEKQHGWWLDMLDLKDLGLIDLEQFNNVHVNQNFTNVAHGSMNAHGEKTPYWICGFCRGYVKGSKVSIKRLCRALQVADLEQKLISKVSPEICPNCYRVRLERERWELIWEIASIWIFYFIVWPMLFVVFGLIVLLGVMTDPEQFGKAMDKIKKRTAIEATDDDDDDDEEIVEPDPNAVHEEDDKERRYAAFHYKDTQLLAHMNEMSTEDDLFDGNVRDDIWHLLAEAKDDIDALVLSDKIAAHIMRLSTEDELTKYEFCDGFVDMDKLKQNGGEELWNEYFRPMTMVLFNRIQELRHNWIPMHLCAKYPFEVQLILDDFAQYFDEKGIEESARGSKNEILEALASLKFLDGLDKDRDTNKAERKFILTTLEESIETKKKKKRKKKKKKRKKKSSAAADGGYTDLTANTAGTETSALEESALEDSAMGSMMEDSALSGSFAIGTDSMLGGAADDSEIYDKFVDYLYDVQALFQETRKIKNMLRDVSTAIVERGINGKVFQDQIYFLFEDIPDAILSIPFFNSMRLELIGGELKVGLWTIRNTLKVLYFINNCVRKQLLTRHPRVYVQKEELTHKIYKQFANDISDPDGLTDMIYTPDMDAIEEMKAEEADDDMEKMKSMERNKSAMEDEAAEADDADDGMTDAERRAQIKRRMDLFQKEEITARAVSREISAIFDKIQASRSDKITETTIDHYRRNALGVRLLEDDESLRYIFEQLSRYATFFPKKMKQECSPDLLKEILCKTTKFHEDYEIDRETIPSIIQQRLPPAFKSCPVCHKINDRPEDLTRIRMRCVNEKCKSMERKRKKTGVLVVPSKVEKKEEEKDDDQHVVSINIAPKQQNAETPWEGEWCYLCCKQWMNFDKLTGEKVCGNSECKSTKTAPKEIDCPKCKSICKWTEETGRKTECDNADCSLNADPENRQAFCWTCLKPWKSAGIMVCGNDCFEITCRADRYIKQLYDHIAELYAKADFSDEIMKQTLPYLTLEDTLSILMLYERVFSTLSTKLVARTDTFVATHDIFCKFVDSQGFNIEQNKQYWTNKTKAASELFQSVLDEQQNFITLGQVSQSIDKLMHDIHVMDCGELARVMNHLFAKVQKDNDRCVKQREEYVEWQNSKQGRSYMQKKKDRESTALEEQKMGTVNEKHVKLKEEAKPKGKKNPGLAFAHVGNRQWNGFIAKIADSFEMNVRSKKISEKLLGHEYDEKTAADLADQETERKRKEKQRKNTENLLIGRSTSASENFGDEEKRPEKKIIDAILDNTAFDVILKKGQIYANVEDDNQVGELLEAQLTEKNDAAVRKLRKKRNDVFDTMLSFNSGRITLQQLFSFSRSFRRFLKMNKHINDIMKKYRKLIKNKLDPAEVKIVKAQYKSKRLNTKFEKFEKNYFSMKYFPKSSKKPVNLEQYAAEISWLYYGTENQYDLCHRMYPFWAGTIIKDIDAFMESTEQIQGIYELKAAEFGQLKHSLNVNDELAERLFHIIRFKIRTLSWSECYHFFVFVLKMKYNVQKAIIKSPQAEDTTVSMDGMKAIMEIASNDEAVWLFNKVDSLHGAKVTWKQMLGYLKKMVAVRDDMRDFFSDQERDRTFEESQAELVHKMATSIEEGNDSSAMGTKQMLKALKKQSRQIDSLLEIIKKQDAEKQSNQLGVLSGFQE